MLEVLRWLRTLDTVLRPLCRRPFAKLDPEVRVALRLGLVEAMKLGVAPALATDGAVRLVRRLGCSSASGMVNAILRKAVLSWPADLERSSVDVAWSHPWWIYDRWRQTFGQQDAETSMASAQERSETWVWFLDEMARARLQEAGVLLEAHSWCPGAWSAPEDPKALVREVVAGTAYAQDPSSLLVAQAALGLAGDGTSLVDLCAAPGGKTAFLAKHRIWRRAAASDLRLVRARLVSRLVGRISPVSVAAADATVPPFEPGAWDLVLLDAPCTGTGTFRRHPEIKWRLQPASVAELAGLQRKLFRAALDLVSIGGVLLYSTCSIEPEENEGIVGSIGEGFEAVDLSPVIHEDAPWRETETGGARILPNPDGDGFTMHAVRRVG